MGVPVLTFFNNKGGVGKTSLVYHLAWMFSEMGKRVIAVDLDPQANLTSAFLPERDLSSSGMLKITFEVPIRFISVSDLLQRSAMFLNLKLSGSLPIIFGSRRLRSRRV